MIPVSLLLAWRYLTTTGGTNNFQALALFCCLSIAVGSGSLALITSVMSGFEKTTYQKFKSVHPDIIMHQYGQELAVDAIESIIKQEFPAIHSISPSSTQQCSIRHDPYEHGLTIITLKGINPAHEQATTHFASTLKLPAPSSLPELLQGNSIVVGERLARQLGADVGDVVTIAYALQDSMINNTIALEQRTAQIRGIFKSGIEEFDEHHAYCSLDFFNILFAECGVQTIGLALTPLADESATIAQLQQRFGITVHSWKELYPSLFSALKLEKYAVVLVVSLVLLMACFSIVSLLLVQLHIKRTDIALLYALGMQHTDVKKIFLLIGATLGLLGSFVGLVVAAVGGVVLQAYPFIQLPDSYYTTHLPVHMQLHVFVAIFILCMALCIGATWIPLSTFDRTTIAATLKNR